MKRRYNSFGIYRIIAALAIIQFHIYFILVPRDIPCEFLLSKAVQGFTALSGFLYARKKIPNARAFIVSSFKKLAIPTLASTAVMIIWNTVYFFVTDSTDFIALFFDRRAFNGSLLIQPGNYYYLAYIFICYLMTPYLAEPKSRRITVATVLGAEILLAYFFDVSIILTAYIIGYFVGKYFFEAFTDTAYRPMPTIISLISLALSLGAYAILIGIDPVANYALSHLLDLAVNISSSAFGVSSFFVIILILKPLNRYEEPGALIYTDRLTLTVFLFNQAFTCGAMNVTKFAPEPWQGVILVYLFTIGAAVLVDFILNILPKLIKKRES